MKYILTLLAGIILIASCQKEFSFEGGAESEGLLQADVFGNCFPVDLFGIYKEDSAMGSGNYVEVEVIVNTGGTYNISTDTVNGVSFRSVGMFGAPGNQVLRLSATGTPVSDGSYPYTIRYGNSTCTFNVEFVDQSIGFADFTLAGDPAECTGAVVDGDYTAGVPLTSNSVTVSVNVLTPGLYNISTAQVNGVTFSASGIFTNTGVQSVVLSGSGTPTTPGVVTYNAGNAASTCTFVVTVELPAGGDAAFTLEGNPGSCSGATVSGVYTPATPLNSTNIVSIQVNVTAIGNYNISTGVVNGYSFSGIGSFNSLGIQSITLNGSGVPAAAGTDNFTVSGGGTSCTFSVNVTATAPPQDYIPQTSLSNWTYHLEGGAPEDSIHVRILPTNISLAGQSYRIFENVLDGDPQDSVFYRKDGGKYYYLFRNDIGMDNDYSVDGLVLDSNLNVNASWSINLGNNSVGGTPLTHKITATIMEKGVTATVAGNTYNNIIKVRYRYSYNIGTGDTDWFEEVIWYAKGYGPVVYLYSDVPTTTTDRVNATRVQIF